MTHEAHRSQYDTLALNMRNALPKAAFIGFTGTPLMAGGRENKGSFGDYVSIYNFRDNRSKTERPFPFITKIAFQNFSSLMKT